MTTLREAAQQALRALEGMSDCYVGDDDDAGECASCHERSYKPHASDCKKNNAITALRAALAQPEHKPHCALLRIPSRECDCRGQPAPEPVATTQQPVEQTPPSDYRRGYWAGFEIGKREGRIEAEDALAQPAPAQRLMHPELRKMWEDYFDKCFRAMPAPPQRKPLALTDLQEALVYTNLIDRDAIDNPEEYDDGSTLAQVDELHSIIKERV